MLDTKQCLKEEIIFKYQIFENKTILDNIFRQNNFISSNFSITITLFQNTLLTNIALFTNILNYFNNTLIICPIDLFRTKTKYNSRERNNFKTNINIINNTLIKNNISSVNNSLIKNNIRCDILNENKFLIKNKIVRNNLIRITIKRGGLINEIWGNNLEKLAEIVEGKNLIVWKVEKSESEFSQDLNIVKKSNFHIGENCECEVDKIMKYKEIRSNLKDVDSLGHSGWISRMLR